MPCEGIGKTLTADEMRSYVAQLPGWTLEDAGKAMVRDVVLKSFVQAVDLIGKIKDIAEDQMHHPDIHLTRYKNLRIVLYTHALNGITENDVIMAAKINEVIDV